MKLLLPTIDEINAALATLGNWRVLHTQEACWPYNPISASTMLALGFRETGLKNVCGGAKWNGTEWVQSFTDRGWLQISDTIDREAKWLATQEGCTNGYWSPSEPPVNALTPMHCPRFSPALDFTKATMLDDMQFAAEANVPAGERLRFAVAEHNAGPTGALEGWRDGNIDKNTTGGDYSAYVLGTAPLIHNWIVAHPRWVYHT